MRELPKIGTAVWVRKDGRVLLGKRVGENRAGSGQWCPPGGHLEMFETLEECVIRETHEEAGLGIKNIRFVAFSEDPLVENSTHYVTFHYVADLDSGTPRSLEGEAENWDWFDWNNLPQPLFRPAQLFFNMGINPLLN